ncbi:MAG: NUDIX domain-containing protein [bacterium]|nr:NUDIX domain-containing protein [bacterium]
MKQLLVITESDVAPGAESADCTNFKRRDAARAVLLDKNGGVFLLKIGKHDCHKLPGGGVDDGEDMKAALARELLEEVGCKAEILDEVGEIIEYRDQFELIQTSHCYLARQTGEQVEASLEEGEIEEGLHEVKASSIDEAISLLENDEPDNYECRLIKIRDTALLKKAKEIMVQK